ncbi:MAG: hypothetical protein QXL89_09990 [Nitrososphaeria archaeon]
MDLVVTSVNGVIKVGILSASLLGAEDPHARLDEVKAWERKYINFVNEGRRILSEMKNPTNLEQKWLLGDLIYSFLNSNKGVNLLHWDKSIARDIGIQPTEKRKEGFGESDVKALVNLRKIFKAPNDVDTRISWELIYFVSQIIVKYMERKKIDTFSLPKNKLINEILEVANQEARFAVKGNSGHAVSVTKKLMESILRTL